MNASYIDELRNRVSRLFVEKTNLEKKLNSSTGIKYNYYCGQYETIKEQWWLAQEELDYYESEPIASDDEIELRRFGEDVDNIYHIYLKGQGIKVGFLQYYYDIDNEFIGNVGYVIDARFRGHNFAYKGMILLSDYLYKNGIPYFHISVNVDNKASLKTIIRAIMNYGGDICNVNRQTVTFKCNTREKDNTKKTS